MRENITSTVTVNHAYPSGTHDRSSFDGEPRLVRRPPELPPTSFDGDPKLDKRASELPPSSAIAHSERKDGGGMGGVAGCGDGEGEAE
jgi:hypothetical protein